MGDVPALTVPHAAREPQNVQTRAASVLTRLQAAPVHSRERAVPLLPGCLAISRDDPGGDPAAVLDLDPLTPRPRTHFRRAGTAAGRPAASPPRSRPGDLPAGRDEPGQRAAQFRLMRHAEVNLILTGN